MQPGAGTGRPLAVCFGRARPESRGDGGPGRLGAIRGRAAETEPAEFASSELIPDIDFEAAEQQLRRAASELNVDLDALLSATESLFGEGRIRPRKQPLEESELESLFEDDQNAQ